MTAQFRDSAGSWQAATSRRGNSITTDTAARTGPQRLGYLFDCMAQTASTPASLVSRQHDPILSQSGPAPLGESLERTRQHNSHAGRQIALAQYDVGGQIVSGPALEQGGNTGPQLVEKVAKFQALLHVQRHIGHTVGVYEQCPASNPSLRVPISPPSRGGLIVRARGLVHSLQQQFTRRLELLGEPDRGGFSEHLPRLGGQLVSSAFNGFAEIEARLRNRFCGRQSLGTQTFPTRPEVVGRRASRHPQPVFLVA